MLCSEWVPSEWESDKNITIIHSTPVHQLTSGEDKRWNKSSIKTFLTTIIESIIHNNSSSVKKCICCCLSHQNPATYLFRAVLIWCRFLSWFRLEHFFTEEVNFSYKRLNAGFFIFCLLQMLTDELEWCGLLWCFYQTLILTAPIHCRASIAETLMQWCISTNLMKTQTHPDLRWSWDVSTF